MTKFLNRFGLWIVVAFFIVLAVLAGLFAQWLARPLTAKDFLPREIYPAVAPELLKRCEAQLTAECFADIAWALIQEHETSLDVIARHFAQLEQWDRAAHVLDRIPQRDGALKELRVAYVEGERLARALSRSKLNELRLVRNQMVLSQAADRLLGYLDDGRGQRLNRGFWGGTLEASPSTARALLATWERLIRERVPYGSLSPDYGRPALAEKWLIVGERERARAVLNTAAANAERCDRKLITIWLRLGDPERAFESIKDNKPVDRGACTLDIAKWFEKHGNAEHAIATATDAAEDLLEGKQYGRMIDAVAVLAGLKQTVPARQLASRAEQVGWNDLFSVFNVSAAGEMFGLIGDLNECQRLQAKALGVKTSPGQVVDWRTIRGRASWEGGIFNLGRDLTNVVAARRIGCGDRTALSQIDNRVLSQYYCELYRRARLGPPDIGGRAPMHDDDVTWLLTDRAAECHFELGEHGIALSLLQQLMTDSRSSMDYGAAYSAAEIACVYTSGDLCSEALNTAGRALIEAVGKRTLSAYSVIRFAAIWQSWGETQSAGMTGSGK